jgi:hypothetical protein
MLPAVSAVLTPAIAAKAKLLVKSMNCHENRKKRTAREEHELPQEQEEEGSSLVDRFSWFGIAIETNRVVPTEKHEERHQSRPGNFDRNIGEHKEPSRNMFLMGVL